MKHFLAFLILSILSLGCSAFTVKTTTFKGKSTGIERGITVVLPDSYSKNKSYKVIYTLHGYGGSHKLWNKGYDIPRFADIFNIIIVYPDGGKGSWYADSQKMENSQNESYIAKDVINYIDSNYSTLNHRGGRAITGFSMGGFGALHIAINHQDLFGAVGSISGAVDFRPFSQNWDLPNIFGVYEKNKAIWDQYTIANQLDKIRQPLPIAIEVGVEDFFLKINRELHATMLKMKIPHDYTERPGGHNGIYLNKAIPYQFLFLVNALNEQ